MREKIPRSALVAQIANKSSLDIKTVDMVLNSLRDSIIENANKGFSSKINGFVEFELVKIYPRKGVNPKTGEEIKIDTRFVINAKVSDKIQKEINYQERE